MFRQDIINSIEQTYQERLFLLGEQGHLINNSISTCDRELALALKYLYGNMPVSDACEYSFDVILDYAAHGVWLYKNGTFAGQVDDEIFLNYVLYHRINNEAIDPCRSFFHTEIEEWLSKYAHIPLRKMNMAQAALEVNYWCAAHVTYQTADDRTASPLAVYNSGIGRCGEESAFAVSALRSMGIPARQVYAPRWSHCDDNHAWAEIFHNGTWHFLGACEPEAQLNRGWFVHAASRAMLIHARTFGSINSAEDKLRSVGSSGCENYSNQLSRYAHTKTLHIEVLDDEGKPAAQAHVSFCILNFAEFFPIANLIADEEGKVDFTTGNGSLLVCAHDQDNKFYGEKLAKASINENIIVNLTEMPTMKSNVWQDFEFTAPDDRAVNQIAETDRSIVSAIPEEVAASKFEQAQKHRQKTADDWHQRLLDNMALWESDVINREDLYYLLKPARSNWPRIFACVRTSQAHDNMPLMHSGSKLLPLVLRLLRQLRPKDLREYDSRLLLDHLRSSIVHASMPYKIQDYDLFDKYILSPRIYLEPITPWRGFITNYFDINTQMDFRARPKGIMDWLRNHIVCLPHLTGPDLFTSPETLLRCGIGDQKSIDLCFVAICRTLGLAARLKPQNLRPQYWLNEGFVDAIEPDSGTGRLIIKSDDNDWIYRQNWSLAKLSAGMYESLNLEDVTWQNDQIIIEAEIGIYRLITSERLPNGNQIGRFLNFSLEADGEQTIHLTHREYQLDEMLENIDLGTFAEVSSFTDADNLTIMLWLQERREPTEHIINELFERAEQIKQANLNVVVHLSSQEAYSDSNISRLIEKLPQIRTVISDFSGLEKLARRVYQDPANLPLILVVKPGASAIFSLSGYNVGTADLILRIYENYKLRL
jgi:hypothetical protein